MDFLRLPKLLCEELLEGLADEFTDYELLTLLDFDTDVLLSKVTEQEAIDYFDIEVKDED